MKPFHRSGMAAGGATRSAYDRKRPFLAVLDWGPSGTPRWPSLAPKTIPIHYWGCALTCSTLVSLCSISLEPPDPLMAQKGRFGPFWTLWGPSGTPIWPSLNRKTVPIHHWGCALTCSTLVPLCSTSLEPPDPLMAQKGRFWQFWTLWGPSGAPIWPSLTRETVSMHHQGYALPCSTLVPLCSTSLETPDLLMPPNGDFGRFGAL